MAATMFKYSDIQDLMSVPDLNVIDEEVNESALTEKANSENDLAGSDNENQPFPELSAQKNYRTAS